MAGEDMYPVRAHFDPAIARQTQLWTTRVVIGQIAVYEHRGGRTRFADAVNQRFRSVLLYVEERDLGTLPREGFPNGFADAAGSACDQDNSPVQTWAVHEVVCIGSHE